MFKFPGFSVTLDAIVISRSVRQGGVLSTFPYLVYVNALKLSGYGCKVLLVAAGNPAFADDVSLLALTPFNLQIMLNFGIVSNGMLLQTSANSV